MRKIQLRHSFVSGSEAEYGSGGQMCSGWVRHVRGVYDSTNIRSEIWVVCHLWLYIDVEKETNIFSCFFYPLVADLYDVGRLVLTIRVTLRKSKKDDSPRARIRN